VIPVIPLTRLNGTSFALNPDLVARADVTPDTVLTLTDGAKYVVTESLADVVHLIIDYRAAILRAAAEPEVSESRAQFQVESLQLAADHEDPATVVEPTWRPTVVPLYPRRV